MKIASIDISNYCGIRDLHLDFEPRTNILIGVNGAGKSSVMRCIAILMSWFTKRLVSPNLNGQHFDKLDISNRSNETKNAITVSRGNLGNFSWALAKVRRGKERESSSDLQQLKELVEQVRNGANRPLFVYYPTNRSVLDIPLRIRKKHEFDWLSAYDNRPESGVNFRIFFEWYRTQQEIENSDKVDSSGPKTDYEDPLLKAVRNAIYHFLPGYQDLRIRFNPLRMVVSRKSDSQELDIRQLSDGEKCLLALVGDLARRLALLNPNLDDGRKGAGIVLIDEIELHLHPQWQRSMIGNLEQAFPGCQFILATHSPLILSEARNAKILEMNFTPEGVTAPRRDYLYGADCNRILEETMGTSERPVEVKEILRRYFELIARNQWEDAALLRKELEDKIGKDEPELVKADVLLRRKEIIGR